MSVPIKHKRVKEYFQWAVDVQKDWPWNKIDFSCLNWYSENENLAISFVIIAIKFHSFENFVILINKRVTLVCQLFLDIDSSIFLVIPISFRWWYTITTRNVTFEVQNAKTRLISCFHISIATEIEPILTSQRLELQHLNEATYTESYSNIDPRIFFRTKIVFENWRIWSIP